MLLDTASLYFRAFFGVPDTLRAPDGTPVNAVRGLLDFIARWSASTSRPPWWPAGTTTGARSGGSTCSRRYKAHRVVALDRRAAVDIEETPGPARVQVPMIVEVLAALGIPVVGAPGYEADDVIGTLATDGRQPVDVVTGDRDLFQLVDDDARRPRPLHRARVSASTRWSTRPGWSSKYGVLARAVRRLRGHARRPVRRAARASPASATRPPRACCSSTATWTASSPPRPTRRRRSPPACAASSLDAGDYLDVAPRSSRSRGDIDLRRAARPTEPASSPSAGAVRRARRSAGASAARSRASSTRSALTAGQPPAS